MQDVKTATRHAGLAKVMADLVPSIDKHGKTKSVTDSKSVGSNFGAGRAASRALWLEKFTLDRPLQCVLDWEARHINETYLYANIVWTLAGSDDAEWIAYYNPRGRAFSPDGKILPSAWGPKLVRSGDFANSQIGHAIRRLRHDQDNRRAAIDFLSEAELVEDRIDISCSFGMVFEVDECDSVTRLNAITFMRSQSAVGVMPYDVPLMVAIQSLVAAEVGVEIGTYGHVAASMHVYEDELASLYRHPDPFASIHCSDLPAVPTYDQLTPLFELEKALRHAAESGNQFDEAFPEAQKCIDDTDMPLFVRHAVSLFREYALARTTHPG